MVESFLSCLVQLPKPANCPLHYNSTVSGSVHHGFKHRLFPFHSQLLRESLLFSFPALNDMLKFSALSGGEEGFLRFYRRPPNRRPSVLFMKQRTNRFKKKSLSFKLKELF